MRLTGRCRRTLLTALAVLWCVAGPARADGSLPDGVTAKITLRVLAFDRDLVKRSGDVVTLAVLSDAAGARVVNAFKPFGKARMGGRPIKIISLTYSSPARLKSALREQRVDALYVTAGLAVDAAAIPGVALAAKVPTVTGSERSVAQGYCIGVVAVGGKPRVIVNLPVARKHGMNLSYELLQLAKVLR